MHIDSPFNGAVLSYRHGRQSADGLTVTVTGSAGRDLPVTVNGAPASRQGEGFSASLTLVDRETDIVATAEGPSGRLEHRIRVAWDRHSRPRYRFSIDDNSFFLRDIVQKQYASLFDCFYLAILRDLHARYGAKFVLNIYYTTGDDFDLPQFPDRYRSEWVDNAHWLRLAFHANANDPDRPYQYATADRIVADWDRVEEQILRFAGEEVYSAPTVFHWAMTPPTVFKALHDRGVRVLSGYFVHRGGTWDINYRIDDTRSEYLSRNDALVDWDSGIVFSKVDIICNSTPLERIVPTLSPLAGDPNTAEVMDLFTHEQYFWPFYRNYLEDHARRLDTALRWVTDNGYEPVFFHEGYFARPI